MISVLTIGSLYWLSVSASYKQRDGVQQCTSNIARISLEACKNFLRQKYFREIFAQPKPETISSLGEQSLKSVAKNLLGDMSFTEYNCLLFQENPSSHSWITCRYLTEKFGPHSKGNMCSLFLAPVYIPCMNNFSQPLSFVKIQIWVLHVLCLVFVFVFLNPQSWCFPQSWNIFIFLGISCQGAPPSILGREKNINSRPFAYWLNLLQSHTSWDKAENDPTSIVLKLKWPFHPCWLFC